MSDPNAGLIHILRRTQPWVRLLSILGFLWVAMMVVVGLGGGAVALTTDRAEAAVLLMYPVVALVYFFPSLYLYRYSKRIGLFVAQGHTVQLEAALEAQRVFWRFVGVVTLVAIGLTLLVVVVAIAVGVLAGL